MIAGGTALCFTVYGHPRPAGSKRALPLKGRAGGRPIVVDANPHSKEWKHTVATVARDAYRDAPLAGPLSVTMTFYRPRPMHHFGSGRNCGTLKASAPACPVARPDVLKLARAVEDACTGILWMDDAQIVDERLLKKWGTPSRVELEVRLYDEQ